ncbi:hypothetical protein [Brasilonema sp. UFV-L1]|uniref:hypothetical protein n=1 Tax=Brasilonema sp. UFV-L1 TaxID=2234130 RepID=UPI00145E92BF|nr:hypothetical protein [Brasilonema sp. UFV-L1]NMG09359.1 hypothetical protein [Brasilonema sp. UFV-L1]
MQTNYKTNHHVIKVIEVIVIIIDLTGSLLVFDKVLHVDNGLKQSLGDLQSSAAALAQAP